jgi:hypothetical protein
VARTCVLVVIPRSCEAKRRIKKAGANPGLSHIVPTRAPLKTGATRPKPAAPFDRAIGDGKHAGRIGTPRHIARNKNQLPTASLA